VTALTCADFLIVLLYEECQTKYGNASVWKACCQVFDFLALAAIVDGKVLCVHGGLSPEIRTLDQIRVVARAQEIPHEGAFCDLVWSDPEDVDTWAVSPRGAGWLFGDKVSSEVCFLLSLHFLHASNLVLVQPCQRPATHCSRSSAGQRRLQISFQGQGCCHRLVCTQLLLPLRKRCFHYESGRGPQARVSNFLRCARP
jgi:diadenosine tetraphosphatase ApaH/serine/threonine PP2A family protein phosphatase